MDLNQVCSYCLSEKVTAAVCPICGHNEEGPPDSPLFLLPRTILNGRYILGRVLGYGGFGITYLALDFNLGIKLAIKEYFPQSLATRASGQTTLTVYTGVAQDNFAYGLAKFLEEAKTLARFNDHPCIITVHDFFKENGTGYMVMEYIEGITFKEYLDQKGGKVSYEAAIEVMTPIMDALREVHSVGLLHRDISPDNIYITAKKQIKLLDFGAARYAMGEHSNSLSVILKPGYAPMEQYHSKGIQGPWTDVYAVAATIYRAITGEVPLESVSRMEMDTLQPPSELGFSIPPKIEAALIKALTLKTKDRFQTIHEFQEALVERGQAVKAEKIVARKPAGLEQPNFSARRPAKKASVNHSGDKEKMTKWKYQTLAVITGVVLLAGLIAMWMVSVNKSIRTAQHSPGQSSIYKVGDVTFNLHYVPGGLTFPTDHDDVTIGSPTVNNAYWIAQTDVTYELWSVVYTWSTSHGYTFAHAGKKGSKGLGSDQQPVTSIDWRDAIVWCNALTEYYNAQNKGAGLACVYTYKKAIVRDATNKDACDDVTANVSAKGFRLPTNNEWELAARYIDGKRWTPGNYASGAMKDSDNGSATQAVAWYDANSGDSTHPVAGKAADALDLYDMSGNVWQWCFDRDPRDRGSARVLRGSCWYFNADILRLGNVVNDDPNNASYGFGFRPVRTQ